jgi:hypothetical protein
VGIARTQHRGQGKAVAAVEDEERVIHVLFVITVEEAELLLAMGGVIGGVHVQDDDLAGTGMGLEVQIEKPVREPAQVSGGHLVFEAGERGLGGQVNRTFRSLTGHDLESRVLGEPGGIVIVFVTQGDGKQTLTDQGEEIVFDLAGIPGVMHTGGRLLGDAVALIQLTQQQAASIRGYLATLQVGDDFLGEKTFKAELFMADCFHRVSCLRGCLSGDYSILTDTLSFFKNFS